MILPIVLKWMRLLRTDRDMKEGACGLYHSSEEGGRAISIGRMGEDIFFSVKSVTF